MKTFPIIFLVFASLSFFPSCRDSGEEDETTVQPDQPGQVTSVDPPPPDDCTDIFFPRFSICEDIAKKMEENYNTPPEDGDYPLESFKFEFDQPEIIMEKHDATEVKIIKARYRKEDEERYKLTRVINDDESWKVGGYETFIYQITSNNERTKGRILFYDLATICPPPRPCNRMFGPLDTTKLPGLGKVKLK